VKGEGIGQKGNRAETVFYLDKDAGCLETARMLIESGLCLALQDDDVPCQTGGFVSPAAGLGNILVQRLLTTGQGTVFESRAVAASSIRSKL
jgi:short subunit dehydrogenase-like uncharacterized protein